MLSDVLSSNIFLTVFCITIINISMISKNGKTLYHPYDINKENLSKNISFLIFATLSLFSIASVKRKVSIETKDKPRGRARVNGPAPKLQKHRRSR